MSEGLLARAVPDLGRPAEERDSAPETNMVDRSERPVIEVGILGAGVPTPTAERFGSAYVVRLESDVLMIDCGPAATHKLVKAGVRPTEVQHLFFTHHHFDHDADYPCFLLCRWDQSIGEEATLEVVGPPPTEEMTDGILNAEHGLFSHDWKARVQSEISQNVFVNRGGRLPRPAPVIRARNIEAGAVVERPGWRMTAARAQHLQPYLQCLAYRFEAAGSSVVFSGDGEPCESVRELAEGADMLICMCWDHQEEMDRNGESRGQCGTRGAAKLAREAGVQALVLTHIGPRLASDIERGVADVGTVFEGEIIVGEELTWLRV
jgi:ribonuclease Z